MRILAFSALALGLGLVSIQLSACSNSSEDCNALATCGATAGASQAGSAGKSSGGTGNDGGTPNGGSSNIAGSSNSSGTSGTTGGGGEGGGPSGCNGDVSEDAACWTTNELGVFVSSDAAADGDGTKEAPFKTIAAGIAASGGKHVYICAGLSDYAEKVVLNLANDGLRLYGGFECDTWTYATTRSAQVVSDSNIALRIDGLKKGVYIENLGFTAADAAGTGLDASSYGAFVTESKGVVLTRVELVAGKGAKGADGKDGTKGEGAAAPSAVQNGKPALCGGTPADADGGSWPAPICGSRGGRGGAAILDSDGVNGSSGTPSTNVSPPSTVNLGAGSTDGTKGKDGTDGSSGNAGALGTAATASGMFSMTGFSVASGQDGGVGFPGQGGGGGGASKGSPTCRGASGGAGGMGGCGGLSGKAGEGGGASVGLFSWASDVSLVACEVQSASGGAGGGGGKGGLAGAGAAGGDGGGQDQPQQTIARGGQGGFGGNGGRGGNGSGGTGGPSYALVYSTGAKPTYDAETTLDFGTPGAAGEGGQQVSTVKAPNGTAGASDTELEVP